MKKISNCLFSVRRTVSLILLFSTISIISSAQSTTLASWSGQVLTPTASTNVAAQNITGPTVSVYSNGTNTPSKFYIGSNGAAANLSYFDFTMQPASGYKLDITNISFQISGMNTAATYAVRSSVDGFATDRATGSATMNMSPYTTFDARSHVLSGLNNLTGAVSLRVYKSSASDMLHIYNVQVTGTVATIILPLHFTAFTAKKHQGGIQLLVDTDNEENTDYLLLERSSDASTFAAIAKLPAGPRTANSYSFLDERPNAGNNYYRVKQVDKNAHFAYSNLLKVVADLAPAFKVSPNPVQNTLQVGLGDWMQNNDGILTIQTMNGVNVQSTQIKKNTSSISVDVRRFSKGVYFVHIIAKDGMELSQKFIKE